MNISGSRIRSFLVLVWTALSAVAMLFYAFVRFLVPEHSSPIGLGLIRFQGTTAIFVAILVGIWGLSAAVLLTWSSRLGARMLLLYYLCGALLLGGELVLDLLFGFQIDWITYVVRTGMVASSLLAAWWCWNRAFSSEPNELSILADRNGGHP
jgi:hypothetical protein